MLAPSRKVISGHPRVLPVSRGPGRPRASIRRGASTGPTLPLGGAGATKGDGVPRTEPASRATPPPAEANATRIRPTRYRSRSRLAHRTLARSASEAVGCVPRLRFGFVWFPAESGIPSAFRPGLCRGTGQGITLWVCARPAPSRCLCACAPWLGRWSPCVCLEQRPPATRPGWRPRTEGVRPGR